MLFKKYGCAIQKSLFAKTNQYPTFSHTHESSKMFNITSKYFSFFKNKPPASWVAHITRDFPTCYSCSYYSSMIIPNYRSRCVSIRFLEQIESHRIVSLSELKHSNPSPLWKSCSKNMFQWKQNTYLVQKLERSGSNPVWWKHIIHVRTNEVTYKERTLNKTL